MPSQQIISGPIKNAGEQLKTQVQKVTKGSKLPLIVGIIIIFIILLLLIKKFFKKAKPSHYIVEYFPEGKSASGTPFSVINPHLNNVGEGGEYSYSVWLRIADWYATYGTWKTIFRKGNDSEDALTKWCSYSQQAPALYFADDINNLRAVVTTTNADGLQLEYCDIMNVPIKEWFNIVMVINGNFMVLYINGRMERTCVFNGVVKNNNGPLSVNSPRGFNGLLAKLEYFGKALEPNEIESLAYNTESPKYKKISESPSDKNICSGSNNATKKIEPQSFSTMFSNNIQLGISSNAKSVSKVQSGIDVGISKLGSTIHGGTSSMSSDTTGIFSKLGSTIHGGTSSLSSDTTGMFSKLGSTIHGGT